MACERVNPPDGARAIVCWRGGSASPRCASCSCAARYLCDHRGGDGKTCDAPCCGVHASTVGPDKHHCPLHAIAGDELEAAGQQRLF